MLRNLRYFTVFLFPRSIKSNVYLTLTAHPDSDCHISVSQFVITWACTHLNYLIPGQHHHLPHSLQHLWARKVPYLSGPPVH